MSTPHPTPHFPASCDYDTGTAFSGPAKCGKTARFWWDDQTSGKKRPVCGVHARSVRSKFGDTLSPIVTAGEADQ